MLTTKMCRYYTKNLPSHTYHIILSAYVFEIYIIATERSRTVERVDVYKRQGLPPVYATPKRAEWQPLFHSSGDFP